MLLLLAVVPDHSYDHMHGSTRVYSKSLLEKKCWAVQWKTWTSLALWPWRWHVLSLCQVYSICLYADAQPRWYTLRQGFSQALHQPLWGMGWAARWAVANRTRFERHIYLWRWKNSTSWNLGKPACLKLDCIDMFQCKLIFLRLAILTLLLQGHQFDYDTPIEETVGPVQTVYPCHVLT